jgi:hypothetical protein
MIASTVMIAVAINPARMAKNLVIRLDNLQCGAL